MNGPAPRSGMVEQRYGGEVNRFGPWALASVLLMLPACGDSVTGTAMRAGLIGPHMDLRRQDFSGHDLSDRDLNHVRFDRSNLDGTDLRNANLHRASLRWCDLSNTKLGGADLSEADMRGATLGATPGELDLEGADLRGVTIEGTDLSQSNLDGTDFRGAQADEHTQWPEDFGHPWNKGVKGVGDPFSGERPSSPSSPSLDRQPRPW